MCIWQLYYSALSAGVIPWTDSKLQMSWFSPVKKAIKNSFHDSIQVKSAKDIRQLVVLAIEGEFDVVQVPVHIGMYLIDHYQFRPIVILNGEPTSVAQVVLVTSTNSNIHSLTQAAEFSLALGSPLTLTNQIAISWFKKEGLIPTVHFLPNQMHVLQGVIKDKYQSGAIISGMYDTLTPVLKNNLKLIKRSQVHISGLLVARPGYDLERQDKLRAIFLNASITNAGFLQSVLPANEEWMKKLRTMLAPFYSEITNEIELNVESKQ